MFSFCAGTFNLADVVTRPVSYRLPPKFNYVTGVSLSELGNFSDIGFPTIMLPIQFDCSVHNIETKPDEETPLNHLYNIQRSFTPVKVIM